MCFDYTIKVLEEELGFVKLELHETIEAVRVIDLDEEERTMFEKDIMKLNMRKIEIENAIKVLRETCGVSYE